MQGVYFGIGSCLVYKNAKIVVGDLKTAELSVSLKSKFLIECQIIKNVSFVTSDTCSQSLVSANLHILKFIPAAVVSTGSLVLLTPLPVGWCPGSLN